MLERRQGIRYRVGEGADIVIFRDGGNLMAPLLDLSYGGLLAAIPEPDTRPLVPGRKVSGQLRQCHGIVPWRGQVVHRSPAGSGIGIGIAFEQDAGSTIHAAVEKIIRQPGAGGLHLSPVEQGQALEIHGCLSFRVSRDALARLRGDPIRSIDLSHCTHIDSAGLAMLFSAKEQGVDIVGAEGRVRSLLAIVRIAGDKLPPGGPGVWESLH